MHVYIAYITISGELKTSDLYFHEFEKAMNWIFLVLQKMGVKKPEEKMVSNFIVGQDSAFFLVDGMKCVVQKLEKRKMSCELCHLEGSLDNRIRKTVCCNLYLHEKCKQEVCPLCKFSFSGVLIVEKGDKQVSMTFKLNGGQFEGTEYPPEVKKLSLPNDPKTTKIVSLVELAFQKDMLFMVQDKKVRERIHLQDEDLGKLYDDLMFVRECKKEDGKCKVLYR